LLNNPGNQRVMETKISRINWNANNYMHLPLRIALGYHYIR
jgi:hypothetical protein